MKNDKSKLDGTNVAVLAADGFEYVELTVPCKALQAAGAEVEIISLHEGKIRGMNLSEPTKTIRVDCAIEDVDPEDYDALFIPGGYIGPDLLRQSEAVRRFVRAIDASNKPIATICHGPWVLISAGLVSGRRLASWPGIRDDVVNAGGTWRDEAVVHHQNWVSSRGPVDLPEFVPAMIEFYARGQEAVGQIVEGTIASSPPAVEPPSLLVAATRVLPGPLVPLLTGAAIGTMVGVFGVRRFAT